MFQLTQMKILNEKTDNPYGHYSTVTTGKIFVFSVSKITHCRSVGFCCLLQVAIYDTILLCIVFLLNDPTILQRFFSLIAGQNQFTNWLTYFFIVQLAVCISVQMIYLNKALDTFNTSVVTPIYYVFFTTFVIIASAILYKVYFLFFVEDILLLCVTE